MKWILSIYVSLAPFNYNQLIDSQMIPTDTQAQCEQLAKTYESIYKTKELKKYAVRTSCSRGSSK